MRSIELDKIDDNNFFYRNYFHFILLFLLICICYSNALQNEWHFDDYPNIVNNDNIHIKSLSWTEVSEGIFTPERKISRPLAFLSFALNYYLSGFDTTGYHLVNISIHIACTFFVYLVFVRTLVILSQNNEENKQPLLSNHDIALLAAALWAIHPVQTQAVTYIVQRMASMAAMFYMIAFYSYLCFRTSEKSSRWSFLLLAFLFWTAGVGTKENAILLPLSLLAYEVAFFKLPGGRAIIYIFFAGIVIALGSMLVLSGRGTGIFEAIIDPYEGRPFTIGQRLLTQPFVLCRYLLLILYPTNHLLTPGSDMFLARSLFDPPSTFMTLFLISLLLAFSIIYLKKFPLLCFAVLFFFLNHLIESSFIGLELYFEHRNYLPSVFIYLALAYYLLHAILHYRSQAKTFLSGLLSIALTVVLVSEGNGTYLRNEIWKDEVTLWTDAADKYPLSLRSYGVLSAEYIKRKEYDTALEYFYKAEKLAIDHPERYQKNWIASLYVNAGNIFVAKSMSNENDSAKAIDLFMNSLEYEPNNWQAHVNLGVLFFKQNDLKNAIESLEKALSVRNGDPFIYNLYGRILYAYGELERSIQVFSAGIKIGKRDDLILNLSSSYFRKGEMQLAKQELSKIDNDHKNKVYVLLKALIFTEIEKKEALKNISSELFLKNINICDWINEYYKDNSHEVIHPDISSLTGDLIQAYIEIIDQALTDVNNEIHKMEQITF